VAAPVFAAQVVLEIQTHALGKPTPIHSSSLALGMRVEILRVAALVRASRFEGADTLVHSCQCVRPTNLLGAPDRFFSSVDEPH